MLINNEINRLIRVYFGKRVIGSYLHYLYAFNFYCQSGVGRGTVYGDTVPLVVELLVLLLVLLLLFVLLLVLLFDAVLLVVFVYIPL